MVTQIAPVIDLNPHYLQEVLRILSLYVPDIDVRAFGSRVKWTAKAYSDLDLALMTQRPLSLEQEAKLREAFDESTIPFKVDFVDWAATSKAFQTIISKDSVLIRPATTRLLDEVWTVMPLEDALDALLDYRGKTPDKTNVGVPLITAKIVKNGRIESATEFIAAEKYDEWMTRGLPRVGDVLLTTEAPLGEVAQLHTDRVALAQRLVALRGKVGVLDNTYLCYLLQTDEMQEQLAARATGTTVLGIKQSELRKIAVRLPSLERQRAVVAVLAPLDDRITLLRETNITLEAIAQTLFKSWFVDFDPVHAKMQGRAPEGMDQATAALFPDSFEESELGPVPKGWQVGKLGDVFTLRNERTKPSEMITSLPYVPIECITAKVPFLQEFKSGEEANSSLVMFHEGDILFGAMRPYFHKVCIAPFNGVTRTTVFTLRAKVQKTSGFALFLAYQDATIDYATQHSDGSTIPYAKWKDSLELMPIIFPPQSVQIAFSEVVSSFVARANLNMAKAQILSTLRDTLLPRLISGQLPIEEAAEALA